MPELYSHTVELANRHLISLTAYVSIAFEGSLFTRDEGGVALSKIMEIIPSAEVILNYLGTE